MKARALPTPATNAVEVTGPMPSTRIKPSRRLTRSRSHFNLPVVLANTAIKQPKAIVQLPDGFARKQRQRLVLGSNSLELRRLVRWRMSASGTS